ncbi:MAG: UDP-N-acetylmuramoyl-tripeptide--D-alanyl-D-alanine ligase [Steroidobacteraceae bacterium]
MTRSLGFLAQACEGRLVGADVPFGAVSIDSRTLAPGDLFVALPGERTDGHRFAASAREAGAAGLLVARELDIDLPQVVVDDTLVALASAAAAWRRQFSLPLAGVAGSNGKTTTKEMLASILSRMGPTLATQGNLNNHIGVPLTLFRLEAGHRAAVIEMGANRPGEVAFLTGLAQPTVGLVTNAGAEHLEGFGSLEGAARAEGELFAGLDLHATAIINADDEFAPLWREMSQAGSAVSFGLSASADFRALDPVSAIEDGEWVTRFTLSTPAGATPIRLRLTGRHNVVNAAGAAAAAWACGADLLEIGLGLAAVAPVRGRLQLRSSRVGAWIIDDSYNANPSSAAAGLDVLAAAEGERWLVLGEMAELGEQSIASHVEVGRVARERGVTRLFATGPTTLHTVEAFGAGGRWFPDLDTLAAEVDATLHAGVTLLIKGSRVNRLERLVEALCQPALRVGNGTGG